MVVEIFTDGACSGNPGKGGWGALLRYNGVEKELSGAALETTNNRMEMTAAIEALKALKRKSTIHLYTDSKYLKDGLEQWLQSWKARGFKTADKKPVKNEDLWRELDTLFQKHDITVFWVKGHAGHVENERVDVLAREAILRL